MNDSSARKSAGMRLPPLPLDRTPPNAHSGGYDRESSGESVTSTRKVTVDVKRSPGIGRTAKVGDVISWVMAGSHLVEKLTFSTERLQCNTLTTGNQRKIMEGMSSYYNEEDSLSGCVKLTIVLETCDLTFIYILWNKTGCYAIKKLSYSWCKNSAKFLIFSWRAGVWDTLRPGVSIRKTKHPERKGFVV